MAVGLWNSASVDWGIWAATTPIPVGQQDVDAQAFADWVKPY